MWKRARPKRCFFSFFVVLHVSFDWIRADGGVIFRAQVCSNMVGGDEISMATWKEDTLVSASSLFSTTGIVLSKTAYNLQHFSHAPCEA